MSHPSDEFLRRVGRAVRWVEQHAGGALAPDPLAPRNATEVMFVKVTSSTADGNGHYPGVPTVRDEEDLAWDEYDAVKVRPAAGESLASGTRYPCIPAGQAPGGEPLYLTLAQHPGGGMVTVSDSAGPAVTGVSYILFNPLLGFEVDQTAPGVAQVLLHDATTTSKGLVNYSGQSFAGDKRFCDPVTFGAGTSPSSGEAPDAGTGGAWADNVPLTVRCYTSGSGGGDSNTRGRLEFSLVPATTVTADAHTGQDSPAYKTSGAYRRMAMWGFTPDASSGPWDLYAFATNDDGLMPYDTGGCGFGFRVYSNDTADFCVYEGGYSVRLSGTTHPGGTAVTGGLTFKGGLYISGTASGGGGAWGGITGTLSDQTDLQAALDAKQPLDATLTALAGVTTAADKLVYATGSDTFATTDLTGFGRSLIDDADAAAARTTLGLGTAAVKNTGTSGNTVPLLDGANTWSAAQTFANSSGVKILDNDGSHALGIIFGENLTANRTLTLSVAGNDRSLAMGGNLSVLSDSSVNGTFSGTSSGTNTGDQTLPVAATKAEQEAGNSTSAFTTPGRQKYHHSAAKGWVVLNGTGTPTANGNYNVASITDNGTGDYTVVWDVDFSDVYYAVAGVLRYDHSQSAGNIAYRGDVTVASVSGNPALGSVRIQVNTGDAALLDCEYVSLVAFGYQ